MHGKTCYSFGGPSLPPPPKTRISLDTIKKMYFHEKVNLCQSSQAVKKGTIIGNTIGA